MQAEFVWHKLSADNMDPDFVERRRVGLENFLLRVASHPILSNDKILYHFLTEVHAVVLGVCNIWPVCISVNYWLTEKTIYSPVCMAGAWLEGSGVWHRISSKGTWLFWNFLLSLHKVFTCKENIIYPM